MLKFLKILLLKGVGDKNYPNALKVHISSTGVKLDIDSLLTNDAVTKQMLNFKSTLN